MTDASRYRIAIDIGGTFVDAVQFDQETGDVRLAKAPTTPGRPADGVMEALRRLGTPLDRTAVFVHGTTLGLNAILERRGAVTGILTNEGFRDVFEIGRSDVPPERMYDVRYERPAPVVKRRHRLGVAGRLDARGNELVPLDEAGVERASDALVAAGVQSLAITFLHSYRNPAHEMRAAAIVRARHPALPVSVSSEITREYREYERTATTVLDAYIRPIFQAYISELERSLEEAGFRGRFLIMRSSGGAMTAALASRAPIFTVLSGPAGGIVGATRIAEHTGRDRLLTLDYGGTSLDASVIENGRPLVMHEATLEHFPVLMPVFDIRCIGTGGGSIASVQEGLLMVGPRSAGAVPGPIAYGTGGTEPTTTDAAIVLGYIDPERFLGGALALDGEAARRGLQARLADPLGTDAVTVAAGVFDVLIAKTVGAIREITVERGKDPHEFSLLAFGGAGPMISPLIAREVEVADLIVPRVPAVFSAWGMLLSDLVSEFAQTALRPLVDAEWPALMAIFGVLEGDADARLAEQRVDAAQRELARFVQCRYAGQEHSIEVQVGPSDDAGALCAAFNALHRERYGHALRDPVEAVTLRVRATGALEKPPLHVLPEATASVDAAAVGRRQAFCFARRQMCAFTIYLRDRLAPGHAFAGPAIVDEGTSTTVIHSDQTLVVDRHGQLVVSTAPQGDRT
jgi:N-methylhydantoinase A